MSSWHQYPRRGYRHKRLQSRTSIRILDLYPAEISSEPLRGHLQEVLLDRKPEYEAVSYAWGSGERTEWMEIDHGTYLITHNCDEVLRRLRHRTKTRKLWIDSVCIDQAFQLERNHQVGMMGEVYSKADRVVVWLGRATKDTNAAIKFLLDLAEETRPGWRRQVTFGELLYRKVLKIMDGNSLVFRQVKALFEREWFSRIWPIQEIALARDCRIICGPSSIPIELFMVCLKVLRNATFTLDSIHRVHLHREMWNHVQYYREHGRTKRVTTCSRLLLSARYQNASEPRDKIFAFHGLFDLLGVQFPAPDYTKSIPHVYHEAGAVAMMNDNCLEILSSLTGVNTIEGCPSWVPDWSDSRPISEITIWEENNAARSSFPQFQFWNQGLLMLAGRVIDVVQENSIAFPSSHYCPELRPTESAVLKQWLSQFENVARGFKIARFFADLCEPSWWHTYHYKAFPSDASFQWIDAVKNLREDSTSELDKVLHDWEVLLFAEKNKARTFKGSPPTTSSLVRLHLLLRKLLDRKVMFRTARGRLGIGSMMLQPGDQIALFSGCHLPMIIRPGQEYWQFVAPAYVHGIMEGSAWSDRKSLQNFVFS